MLEIRRLTPAELEPFLVFMDGPAFKAQPQWNGCYCQFYLNTPEQNADPEAKTSKNRQLACDRINSGTMQGYLAFEDGQLIGWMAANRGNNFPALPPTDESVARILCFVVEQEHQGKSVASQLLAFAIADLPKLGFTAIEAAPLADYSFVAHGYRGPRSMFEKAGFEPGVMVDDKHILVHRKLTATSPR